MADFLACVTEGDGVTVLPLLNRSLEKGGADFILEEEEERGEGDRSSTTSSFIFAALSLARRRNFGTDFLGFALFSSPSPEKLISHDIPWCSTTVSPRLSLRLSPSSPPRSFSLASRPGEDLSRGSSAVTGQKKAC